jgi:hypothetical protein
MTGKAAVTALIVASFTLLATPGSAGIEVFDASSLEPSFDRFREIDFEDLRLGEDGGARPGGETPIVARNLRIRGVTFSDPYSLRTGFCSSPTCSPDPQNPNDGNNELFLNSGGEISFAPSPRIVVLDIQGMGDNPFELLVTDRKGHMLTVNSQGVLFGQTPLGLRASDGVQRIAVIGVGGTLGPLTLARVLFFERGWIESRLVQVGPNPGSGPVRIDFALQDAAAIEIDVFDVQGRRVASPARGEWQAGTHAVEWDGLSRTGEPVPSGIYLLRYTYPGGEDWRRVVRLP